MENMVDMMGGKLLSYGVSGFALLMIGFTYYLMRSELKRDIPRNIAIKTIWMFMGLVILSTVAVGFFSIPLADKNEELKKEVNGLTSDMGELMNLITKYEYGFKKVVYTLEKANGRSRSKWNRELVTKYVDFSKAPKRKKHKKTGELKAPSKERLRKEVKDRLDTDQLRFIN